MRKDGNASQLCLMGHTLTDNRLTTDAVVATADAIAARVCYAISVQKIKLIEPCLG